MTNKSNTVTLQVPISKDTHKRLSKLAAQLGVERTLVYERALTYAGLNRDFKNTIKEYCSKKGLGW